MTAPMAKGASKDDDSDDFDLFDNITLEEAEDIFKDLEITPEDEDDEKPKIAKATAAKRRRTLKAWNKYLSRFQEHLDPAEFWVSMVKGESQAKQHCKTFLRLYVKCSKRKELTLGPEEFVFKQGVRSCRTLNTFWKALIAAADAEYLFPKRKQDPRNNYWMLLKRPKNYPGWVDAGPVSQISHWIYGKGAKQMGLSTKLDYEKVEMTARDVNRLLKMLWRRADDIPVPKPIDRIIFHALFLMLNYGGFRQGMVLGRLKFRDIVMAVMRDTDVPEKRRLVVTPTIPRNKL